MSSTTIIKESGRPEEFDVQKLIDSLVRSGASPDTAGKIAGEVERRITPNMRTKHIYGLAKRLLRQYSSVSSMRYSLKRALASLGPSGYPFEKYFARVLAAHGYAVEVNRIVEGYCVTHEVDVLAVKGNEHCVIECKYHNDGGKPTDVKVALYVHSRFRDIEKARQLKAGPGNGMVHQGWLVTNTRCTTDAIKYAECAGLKIVSWRYPAADSLERMIEGRLLYPVNVLPAVRQEALEPLFRSDIVLAQEIADMSEEAFLARSGLDSRTARLIKKQADELCPCL